MKKIQAFSLAEALITLLIVCLITLASVPILTKKKRDLSRKDSGSWVCYRDNNNNLKSFFVINGEIKPGGDIVSDAVSIQRAAVKYLNTGIFSGAGCKFVPPQNAKNLVVTYIGGGGGGAAAYSEVASQGIGNGSTFEVVDDGTYAFLLSSAGGSGGPINDYGAGNCDNNSSIASRPGGSNSSCGSMGAPGSYLINKGVKLKKDDKVYVTYPTSTRFFGCDDGAIQNFGNAELKYNNNLVWQISSGQSGGCAEYDGHNKWRGAKENYDAFMVNTDDNDAT